jgi:hypothetical protein
MELLDDTRYCMIIYGTIPAGMVPPAVLVPGYHTLGSEIH